MTTRPLPASSDRGAEPPGWDAFICYSRRDIAVAERLERALEAFRAPAGLDVGRRRLRVFRDAGDLTGTEYYSAIERNISGAQKLIVLCSPAARASSYVDDEIRRFLERHEPDDLVPVLVAGSPNNECGPGEEDRKAFPEALCQALEMPLATDYSAFDPDEHKVDRGRFFDPWYTLLANLWETSREEIEQRDQKRIRRRRMVAAGVTGGVMAALAGLALFAFQQAEEARASARRLLAESMYPTYAEGVRGALQGGQIQDFHGQLSTIGTARPRPEAAGLWHTLFTLGDPPQPVIVTRALDTGGRVVAFGHNALLSEADDTGLMLEDVFEWLDGDSEDRLVAITAGHHEVVGLCYGVVDGVEKGCADELMDRLASWGFGSFLLDGPVTDEALEGVGALVVGNAHLPLCADELGAVRSFVEAGGGLALAGLGWSWLQYGTGEGGTAPSPWCPGEHTDATWPTLANYPMNRIGALFGVEFGPEALY